MKTLMIKKLINGLVPKSDRRVYLFPHNNGKIDKYDLLNYSADNILSLLEYLKQNEIKLHSVFFLECFDEDRLELLSRQLDKYPFQIRLILSEYADGSPKAKFIRKIINTFIRYSCKVWLSCTPHAGFEDKTKRQKFYCLSYSTPYKSAIGEVKRWDLSHLDHFFETSLLTASIHAAQYRNYLYDCMIEGFPRNDTLINAPRKSIVLKWLETKTIGIKYSKVIVYAPTYREYKGAYQDGCVLGYGVSPNELEKFLEEISAILVVKFHPLQQPKLDMYTPRVVEYEKSYDYTLYDLLAVSDMLISDYSSVVHDYIITGKPVVLDFFDYEAYKDSRGFAFDPIEYVCPAIPCENYPSFIMDVKRKLEKSCECREYFTVQKAFHKYIDGCSAERVWNRLSEVIR